MTSYCVIDRMLFGATVVLALLVSLCNLDSCHLYAPFNIEVEFLHYTTFNIHTS